MSKTGVDVKERFEHSFFVTLKVVQTHTICTTMSSLPYPKWVRGRVTAGWEQRSSGNCLPLDTL